MADFSKFRTAVSGFNRTDVVNYIESASMEHQKALRKLTDERDKLAAENAQLQTQLTGLQARLIQVQADNDALTEQVNTLAQEGSDLADQLKANGGIGSISEQLLDTRAELYCPELNGGTDAWGAARHVLAGDENAIEGTGADFAVVPSGAYPALEDSLSGLGFSLVHDDGTFAVFARKPS